MNKETLQSFVAYCEANPEQRFWQALRNWQRLKDQQELVPERQLIKSIIIEEEGGTQHDTWEFN